eukprot:4273864-Alexandrium_andersonii.AAC.1
MPETNDCPDVSRRTDAFYKNHVRLLVGFYDVSTSVGDRQNADHPRKCVCWARLRLNAHAPKSVWRAWSNAEPRLSKDGV